MREIKFRGEDINGNFVYGLLTKKKIRNNGRISWAIATGDCSLAETIPVNENSVAQFVGYDADGKEIYTGDRVVHNEHPDVKAIANLNAILGLTKPPKDFDVVLETIPDTYSPEYWRLAEND